MSIFYDNDDYSEDEYYDDEQDEEIRIPINELTKRTFHAESIARKYGITVNEAWDAREQAIGQQLKTPPRRRDPGRGIGSRRVKIPDRYFKLRIASSALAKRFGVSVAEVNRQRRAAQQRSALRRRRDPRRRKRKRKRSIRINKNLAKALLGPAGFFL